MLKILTSCRLNAESKKQLLEKFPEIDFSFQPTMKDAKPELDSAEILITYGEDLNEECINQAQNLKWIMVFSAGIEKLPFEAIKKRGILVTNARGISKTPMAEYTVGMMLQVSRKTKQIIENEKQEIWDRKPRLMEISGKTITILGTGAIGCEIARLSKAFHMKTLGVNRSGRKADYFDEIFTVDEMDEAISQGDFIVSVLPSTAHTYHLITAEHFRVMKRESVFINIGRGSIVDEQVIINALENNEIAHAVLDVYETEPLPQGHPFWKMENVTVTPHLSGLSPQYQPRCLDIFEYNLEQYIAGENKFMNRIDLDRGY